MRILIADDHAVVRKALRQIITEEIIAADIVEVTDANQLMDRVLQEFWDVVISDISMPGGGGLEVLQQIRQHFPRLPVLILSVYPKEQYAVRVLNAGASGYLNKESAGDELVTAIHCVLSGRKYISDTLAEKFVEGIDRRSEKSLHETFSHREFEIFRMLAVGRSVSEIGDKLSLSPDTIGAYRSDIMTRMSVVTDADLTIYAIEHKLL